MRQRLALIGFSYFGATVAAVYFGADISLIFGFVFFGAFIISLLISKLRKSKAIPIFLLCVSVAVTVYSYKYKSELLPLQVLDEQSVNITAQVVDIPYDTDSGTVYTLKVLSHDAAADISGFKIRVSKKYAEKVSPYDTVTCKVKLYSLHDRGTSSEAYFAARNIAFTGYIETFYNTFKISDDEKPFNYYILKLRQYTEQALNRTMSHSSASVARAMLIGEKSILDGKLYNQLSVAGSSHIIVVSGLHLSVITCFVFLIFSRVFKRKRIISALSVIFVLLFMAVTGFVPSVCRAGTVCIVSLIGEMLSVKQHRFAGIGLAALLITVFEPFAAGDIGVQFSFATSLGIMLFASPLEGYICNKFKTNNKLLKKPLRAIACSVSVSVSAMVASLPIFVFHLKTFSVYFIAANLILVPIAEMLLVLFLLTAVMFYVPIIGFVSYTFGFVADMLCRLLRTVAATISELPYACVNISYKFISVWLAFTMILVAINILWRRKFAFVGKSVLSSLLILITGICTTFVINADTVTVKISESAAVLNYNGNSAIIFYAEDANTAENEFNYLTANTNNISLVLISADSKECKAAAVRLINTYTAENVIMHEEDSVEIKSVINDTSVKFIPTENENEIVLWGRLKLKTVVCGKNICTLLSCNGKTLLTVPPNTDISEINESALNADICVVGKEVTGLERLSPGIALLSSVGGADENTVQSLNCGYIIPNNKNGSTVLDITDNEKIFIRSDPTWQD